jgi:UDP-glucuronate 4-epimerase
VLTLSNGRMTNRILVTGAAGFVGMHVALRHLERGDEVVGHDNLNAYYQVSLKRDRLKQLAKFKNFQFVEGDLADRQAMEKLFADGKFDVVQHMGAQAGVRYSIDAPHEYLNSNLTGFLNILEGCRQHKPRHLVFASSSSVYGDSKDLPYSEKQNVDYPVSLYAATKKSNELMAHAYAHLYHIPISGLRFFTVYGPWGRPDMAVWKFTEAILTGKPLTLFAKGNLKRDFTYIDDVAEGVVRVGAQPPITSESGAPYRILNIGNHAPVIVNEIVAALEKITGKKANRVNAPHQMGDVEATFADTAAIEELVGFKPATLIEDGLRRFVNWYLDYHRENSG